jgi:predicted GNAT superfamily acetyltransferase
MLGVLPQYQDKGVGYELKRFQRDLVLRQGLSLVRWSVDPLQSRNAFFNIHKLGAVAREYVVDALASDSMRSSVAGLESDRFVVEWPVWSRRVRNALERPVRPPSIDDVFNRGEYAPGLEAIFNEDGLLVPDAVRINVKAKRVYAEIPDSVDQLKAQSMELAQTWRFETRKFFTPALRRGYAVTGFAVGQIGRHERRAYLLERHFQVR